MTRWEYMSLDLSYTYNGLRVLNIWRASGNEPKWIELNAVGAEGWEVCGIVAGTFEYPQRAIFKRPLRNNKANQ